MKVMIMKEYKIISVKQTEAESKMNEMAKEGYRVVSVCNDMGQVHFRNYLLITFIKE